MKADRRGQVTLEDVARHAGVSLATASRALNGSERKVRADLQERVRRAAQELAYEVDRAASQLRSGQAKVVGPDKVEVWSSKVAEPAAVRYAWADNPVCNLYSAVGLPTTPFRTDDWPGKTVNNTR